MIVLDEYRVSDESFVSGANLYYHEVLDIVRSSGIEHATHSLPDLMRQGGKELEALTADDIVVSNAGHYGHVYHLLREKVRGKFRIIRECQAAFHAGYFLQEELCAPLTREGDIILFPSEYARGLYLRFFPESLTQKNTMAWYPLPHIPASSPRNEKSSKTLGYLGRISAEKNADQIPAVMDRLVSHDKDLDLELIGSQHPGWDGLRVRPQLQQHVHMVNARINHDQAMERLATFSLLLFPSTSSFETLGRVIVEAGQLGVPVVAASHAAVTEIVPEGARVEVEYTPGYYPLGRGAPLGRIDEETFASKVERLLQNPVLPNTNGFQRAEDRFSDLIVEGKTTRGEKLHKDAREFLERTEVFKRGIRGREQRAMTATLESFEQHDYRHLGMTMPEICEKMGYRPVLRLN